MAGPSPYSKRRFNLTDGLILTAFTAIGLALCVARYREFKTIFSPEYSGFRSALTTTAGELLTFMLLALTVALIPLRLRQPRAPVRRLCRRIGISSCIYILIAHMMSYMAYLFLWLAWLLIPDDVLKAGGFERPLSAWPADEIVKPMLEMQSIAGGGVIAIWALLFLVRALRRNRDWVDVYGLALSLGWILLFFFDAFSTVLYAFN